LNVDIEHYGTVVISGTGTSFDGKTVADVLAAANIALGGGPVPAGFTISPEGMSKPHELCFASI
jgi:hypothetical protein